MGSTSVRKLCSVETCDLLAKHKNQYCSGHNSRYRDIGDVQSDIPLGSKERIYRRIDKETLKCWHEIASNAADRELGPPPSLGWEPSEGTKAAFREWLGLEYIDGEWVDPKAKRRKRASNQDG